MNKNLIIGITGTNGAGKGELVSVLKDQGWGHISVRGYLKSVLEARAVINITRDNYIDLANELREQYGGAHIMQEMFMMANQRNHSVVIESVRARDEVDFLMKQKIPIIAIDADQSLRYDRISKRSSETDKVDFETFCQQDMLEMYNEDSAKQNITYAMSKANLIIKNNGTLDQLRKEVEDAIQLIYRADFIG